VNKRFPFLELNLDGDWRGFAIEGPSITLERGEGLDGPRSLDYIAGGAELSALPGKATSISGGFGDRGVDVTIHLPFLDLWTLREQIPTQLIEGRVYWLDPADGVIRREHELFRGIANDPKWDVGPKPLAGRRSGMVGFSLEPASETRDIQFPPFSTSDEGRFPALRDDGPRGPDPRGACPIIYGTVKGVSLLPVSDTLNDPIRMILAAHPIVSKIVQIYASVDSAMGTLPQTPANPAGVLEEGVLIGSPQVKQAVDGLGQVYSYVNVSRSAVAGGANMYVGSITGWPDAEGGALDRLGEVLLHIWKTYGGETFYELDRERAHASRTRLNRFRVSSFFNSQSGGGSVLRALESRYAGQFPVVFGFSRGRYGWDAIEFPDESEFKPQATLIYGQNAFERGEITETPRSEVVTSYEGEYDLDGARGSLTASMRLDRTNHGPSRGAYSRWGRSTVNKLTFSDTADPGSVYQLLADQARRLTQVRYEVEYTGVDPRFFDLPSLAHVLVTDFETGWSEEPFLITSATPNIDSGLVDLTLIGLRGVRPTGATESGG